MFLQNIINLSLPFSVDVFFLYIYAQKVIAKKSLPNSNQLPSLSEVKNWDEFASLIGERGQSLTNSDLVQKRKCWLEYKNFHIHSRNPVHSYSLQDRATEWHYYHPTGHLVA